MNTSVPAATLLRRITAADNAAIARVIRQVSAEYGLTADKGYRSPTRISMSCMSCTASRAPPTGWWSKRGSGWRRRRRAAACSEPDICELQKMYFMTSARGQGLAKKLALLALDYAREQGFKRCYLETTAFLTEAIGLYEHLGFEHIDGPLGCTGHVDCEVRMLKTL